MRAPLGRVDAPRVRPDLSGGLAAFQHRNYRLFFGGQLVSVTGTWMQSLAQSWLVLTLTSSAIKLGLVNVLQFAPVLVFGLVAGVLADRIPRQRILLATQAVSGVLAATLAVLTWTGAVRLWHIYVLALILGIVNAFDMPSRQAFVGDMVAPEHLSNAIALNSSLFNMGRLIGPALAGLILATWGPAVCFAINSVSYVGVLAGLFLMEIPKRERKVSSSTGISQIKEGFAYVRATPVVALTMVMVAFGGIFALNFNVWMPLLAKIEFGGGAGAFGLMMASLGLGSLVGALFLAFKVRSPRPRRMLITAAVLGLSEIVMGVAAHLGVPVPLALVIVIVIGFAMTSTMAMANTVVQSTAPLELRGRVMSIYMTLFAGSVPFGAALAGVVSEKLGASVSIALGGSMILAVSLCLLIFSRLGHIEPAIAPIGG
ncbi:MAG: MFS transporter [Thermomicrobiales bacterium]|nr:MFS transporter [Thermomicrobiales bacterium]